MSSRMEEELGTGNGEVEKKAGTNQAPESTDVVVKEKDAESSGPPPEGADGKAVDPLATAEAEIGRWKDLALRSQAELDNFRKRMAREKADSIRFGNAALLESLLPVVDNFRFGLEAARRDAGQSVVVEGMSMVYKQLNDILEEFGVQEVAAEGMPFDPNFHEAVKEEASQEVEEGHVLSVIRKGFRLHDRLLRPANVIVSRGPALAPESGQEPPVADAGSNSSASD